MKPSRARYWTKHKKPERPRHVNVTAFKRNKALSTVWHTLDALAIMGRGFSDLPLHDLVRNRVFAQWRAKRNAAIARFAQAPMNRVPMFVDQKAQRAAFESMPRGGGR